MFSIETAIDYIKSKLQSFYRTKDELEAMNAETSEIINRLNEEGLDTSNALRIKGMIQEGLARQNQIESMIRPIIEWLGLSSNLSGLGAFPIAVAAVAIGAATAIVYHFIQVQVYRDQLTMLKQGYRNIPKGPSIFGEAINPLGEGLGNLAILAVAGLIAYTMLIKK